MFWIFAGLITAISVAVVIYPLTRRARKMESADSYDLTVYTSQLKEIEGDVERGLIDETEAEAARTEVARRLLNAQTAIDKEEAKLSKTDRKSTGQSSARVAAMAVLFIIPLCSLGLYVMLGSPGLQSQPLASRLSKPPEQQSMTELVASAEHRLMNNPDDLEGWKRLAPIYLSMRRTEDATRAYRNVLRLEGESLLGLSNLGEALVVRDAGIVSKEALDLFLKANKLDPDHPKPRFFLAIALGQQGKGDEAIQAWQSLIDDSEDDAPWVSFSKSQISAIQKRQQDESAAADQGNNAASDDGADTLAGPTRDDMEAAAEMDADDRKDMIEGMVTRLSERLDERGGTADEWVQLIRAELVLNRPDMAAKSVSKALVALQSDLDGLEKVKAAARSLGISVTQ
ncbi:c-type cytochrome biogenesis protein CcmI [uncultured Cohaesibacter sp.]|uniref:c-type cytochrome biogenesis protein CcmI n=1 Tax=uncultured Cohaesibacter sp. TaxID=1002546 RepID=UPI0029C82776|nr:c-type cytochrome biogenesis protein CcmI [uncultured Cohaesibacter sp.]